MNLKIRQLRVRNPKCKDDTCSCGEVILQHRGDYCEVWSRVEVVEGCEHEKGLTEYCEPCGRTHGGV